MIKCVEFHKYMDCDPDVSYMIQEYCNSHSVTRDKIINIAYSKPNDNTCCEFALLVYEEKLPPIWKDNVVY